MLLFLLSCLSHYICLYCLTFLPIHFLRTSTRSSTTGEFRRQKREAFSFGANSGKTKVRRRKRGEGRGEQEGEGESERENEGGGGRERRSSGQLPDHFI